MTQEDIETQSKQTTHAVGQSVIPGVHLPINRNIMDAITDGWWYWDFENDSIYLSPSYKRLFGYEDHEIPNSMSGWQDLIHEDDLKHALAVCQKHLEENTPYYITVRYKHKDGSFRWVICRGQAIRDDEGKPTSMVGTHTDITSWKMVEKELGMIAHSDSLTGLPNRAAFLQVLQRMVRLASQKDAKFSVLYIDLDDFKKVNDSLGHTCGDRFLVEVSKRLKSACRNEDYLARVGGDEFVIVSGVFADPNIPSLIAQRIIDNMAPPIVIDHKELYSTPSMGIAVYPEAGDNAELLLKNADTAMYEAKRGGKNNFAYYTRELDVTVCRRLSVEDRLRKAVGNNELSIVYQPVINLQNRKVVGFESLLRWHNAQLGEVSPAEFIPIAEETGLIVTLTDWLIARVIPQFSYWKKRYQLASNYMMSVNISALQLSDEKLVNQINLACEKYRVPPQNFVLEITETALMANIDCVESTIAKLREKGFGVAIDDFGTGYSSLTAVKRLPITHLKMDQGFIQGVGNSEDQAIIKTMLNLGELMNLTVIAEGIEDEDQVAYLQKHHCLYAQGFCLGEPMSAIEIDRYLQSLESKKDLEKLVS